jgi:F420-dependent oxidoreductase-like protein
MKLRVLLEPRYGASYEEILAMAKATEEAGFDAFFRSDHYLGIDAQDTSYVPTDSWTTIGGLARETSRVRLGTLMTAATFRHPGPLAIAVATADAMSNGRVELGLGAGWYEQEHRYFGIPFPETKERFDRMEEVLAIVTGLWTTPRGERFSFKGRFWQLDACAVFPRASQSPRPRIVIGGVGTRRTPLLAARFADEFNAALSPDDAKVIANFHRVCEEVGRDPASVELSTVVPVSCGRTSEEARARAEALGEAGKRLLARGIVGVGEEILRRVEAARALGIGTVYFHVYDKDPAHVAVLGEEVVARLA